MAEHLGNLCCLIVEDIHGSFLAHIFRKLTQYGRLSAGQVAQRCHMLLRQAKAGLGTLVQLRLVQHHTMTNGQSTYQVSLDNAYNLLRTGKLSSIAGRRYGPIASVVLEIVVLVSTALEVQEGASKPESAEFDHDRERTRIEDAVRRLASEGFLGQVRLAHFQIPHDAQQAAGANFAIVTAGGAKGKKAQEERALQIQQELEARLDSHVAPSLIEDALATLNGTTNGFGSDHEVHLFLNYAHVVKSIREQTIAQHVNKTLGKKSAKLAAALMKQMDSQTRTEFASPIDGSDFQPIALTQLRDHVKESLLANGAPHTNGYHLNDVDQANGIAADEFEDREDLENGLSVIAEGSYPWIRVDEETATWRTDRLGLATWLRDQEVTRIVSSRIGQIGMRLVRILVDKGKLDEKLLQEVGLLPAKEMRQALTELQTMGFIELQEVPREPQRQPSRTMFLWFFDAHRARDILLAELYKSMSRMLQRLQLERDRMKATLEKVDREDVKDRIEDFVGGQEMTALQQFRRKEGWLLGEIARLDDSVALLRDM